MGFDSDPVESESNWLKHGIYFTDAQALWGDPGLIEVTVRTTDEPRFLVVGRIGSSHWSGIITYRGGNVQMISVRRSRPEEVQLYESRRTG